MMLDKLEAAYRGADAVRTVLRGHAGDTPTVHLRPHVICSTTHEAKMLALAIAAHMGAEVGAVTITECAVNYEVGEMGVSVSGLLSGPEKDRYIAAMTVEPSRVAAVVLGDE